MNKQNEFVDQVAKKTNVKKEDIFHLATLLQSKDLNNEQDIKDFISTLSKVTNKPLKQQQVNKLVKIIKNKQIPNDIEKII